MTLERVLHQLVAALEARDPAGLHRPISVAQLRDRILPYRLHRSALGLSNSEDYELLVLRLVAEEEGWVRTFPQEAAERARRELAEAIPDLDLAEALGDATIQIGAPALARLKAREEEAHTAAATTRAAGPSGPESEPAAPATESPPVEATEEAEADAPSVEAVLAPAPPPPMPIPIFEALDAPKEPSAPIEMLPLESLGAPAAPAACTACGARLPDGRTVVFCPRCGQQVGALRCVRCGTELESGWRHCVMCGHRALGIDVGLA